MTAAKSTKPRGGARPGAGRPPAGVSLRRAIKRLELDPATIDPDRILAAIAADPEAPATARVAACRALRDSRPPPVLPPAEPKSEYELKWLGGDDE
jgi:hypothetical protein